MADVDVSLVEQAKNGNEQAMETLAGMFSRMIRATARSYFLPGGDADDLFQIGMIGFYDAVKSYGSGENCAFETYARVCVHNRILDAVRESGRKKHLPLNTAVDFDKTHAKVGDDPESIVILRERLDGVLSDIEGKLSDLEKQVLRMYVDGYSYREIAARIGKNTKAVDNAVSRIRAKLI